MTERLFLQPPEIIKTEGPVIFLAGPIQGGPEWQADARNLIHEINPTVIVASPRRDYPEGTFVYERQVDWETHFLREAGRTGVVAFWLAGQVSETPGRAYAQTTRFELAEWKMRHEYEGASLRRRPAGTPCGWCRCTRSSRGAGSRAGVSRRKP